MESNSFEKKIFFLFPSMGVLDDVMKAVMENEYEAYIVSDPSICREVLKRFPHSILFVNIDSGLREPEWATWIQKLQIAPETCTTQVGVFSSRNDLDLREHYLFDIGIQCGFIYIRAGFSAMLKTILSVLNVVEARGRRKFIRVSCADTANCKLNIKQENGKFLTGKILDVSVVGFSCTLSMDPFWEKNEVIRDIQLILSGIIILTNAVYFARREDDGQPIYVMLFSVNGEKQVAPKVRTFVNKTLQARMDKVIQDILVQERKKLREGALKDEEVIPPPPPPPPPESKSDDGLDIEDFGMLEPIDIE